MSEKIVDSVFGEMEYKHRWIKKESVFLMDKEYNIGIYLIESRSEQEIHSEPYPNGKEVNFYGEISFTI